MSARLGAWIVWGLVAASVVFWALRLTGSPKPVPDGAALASARFASSGDLSPLLGSASTAAVQSVAVAAPPSASRFKLTGVVATSQSRRQQASTTAPGIALISVDGAPPKAYRVGDLIDSNLALHSVALRSASIADRSSAGAVAFVLELPPPVPAATGTLQAGVSMPFGGPPPSGPPPTPMPMPVEQPAAPPNIGTPPPQFPPGFQPQGMPLGMPPPPASGPAGNDPQSRLLRQ
ncbi:type II secretion system protein N [Piscinibacter sakaiensis]|uniref:type II secretion system protein N n=1 Tax=Piscinibacter sakaiensis TaxID=1547922 RepID=UPI003AADEE70